MDVFAEVKKDLDTRNEIGRKTYGGELDVHCGRDWLLEAYQEALDQVVYLKAALLERGPR